MGDNDGQTVKAVETMFTIVETLKELDGAGVTELADELDLAKSSVHKHLRTLEDHRCVVNTEDGYYLGLEFFQYGSYVRNQYEVFQASKARVKELAEETGEMVWLVTEENGLAMNLYGDGGSMDINVDSLMGTWTYLHLHSGGKAILSQYSEERVREIVDRHGLPRQTERTITDLDGLLDELAEARERGYALNLAEDVKGIHAIGAPVMYGGEVQGAISIAGAAHRLTERRCHEEYADLLLTAVNDLELNLTYK